MEGHSGADSAPAAPAAKSWSAWAAASASLVAIGTLALQAYTLHLHDQRDLESERRAELAKVSKDYKGPMVELAQLMGSYVAKRARLQQSLKELAAHPDTSLEKFWSAEKNLGTDYEALETWQQGKGVLLPTKEMDEGLGSYLALEALYRTEVISGLERTSKRVQDGKPDFDEANANEAATKADAAYATLRERLREALRPTMGA